MVVLYIYLIKNEIELQLFPCYRYGQNTKRVGGLSISERGNRQLETNYRYRGYRVYSSTVHFDILFIEIHDYNVF